MSNTIKQSKSTVFFYHSLYVVNINLKPDSGIIRTISNTSRNECRNLRMNTQF